MTYSYRYDPYHKLRQVTGGTPWVRRWYGYTAGGERVWEQTTSSDPDAGNTYVIRDLGGRVLRRFHRSGGVWRWKEDYIWGPEGLLATVSPDEGRKHYVVDHLGSLRLVCDRCAHTLATHNYYPYGEEATYAYQDRERIKFTGHERDLGLDGQTTDDLDYMHARYYTFNLGRFMSVDPVGGEIGSSQSWNRYSYVVGNPINLIDPFGLAENQYNGEGVGLHLAEAIQIGGTTVFFDNITVTGGMSDIVYIPLHGNDPVGNMMAMMLYMDITGWHGYSYVDPYREMLRVAGGGRPYTDQPTFDDYMRWFGESYYNDMVNRGIVTGGLTVGLLPPFLAGRAGVGLSGGQFHYGARLGSGQLKAFGISGFLGGGLKFGSVGPITTRAVITIGMGPAVRFERITDFSGTSQYRFLVGFGISGGFVDYFGAGS